MQQLNRSVWTNVGVESLGWGSAIEGLTIEETLI